MSLKAQTNSNNVVGFGYNPNESLNQSVFFPIAFSITTVVFQFDTINIDTQFDVKVRLELRRAFGPDNLLNINSAMVAYSGWLDDSAINTTQAFTLGTSVLDAGHYWLSLVTNRINTVGDFELAWQNGGSFINKFMKIEGGTGIYRSDSSLKYTVNGGWSSTGPLQNKEYEISQYIITTIRDEQ